MDRELFAELEERILAPYAMRSRGTRGRRYPEEEHSFRLPFQRDRDRIIHCTAFRRLEAKTQVFVDSEGDYYRTRLTHTMEVAQITRTLARALRLNEDLAEAVALVHDLGHPPFGHAGERQLDELMAEHGGFDHNAQCLRIVEELEQRYPAFPGLNLTYEVREGIAKHAPPYDRPIAVAFDVGLAPPLEIQIVDCADEIAYTAHDIDDGLKSGMLDAEALGSVELWQICLETARARCDAAAELILTYQAIRALIDFLVRDVLEHTSQALRCVQDVADLRRLGRPLAGFRPETATMLTALKSFLAENLYAHPRVLRMTRKAQRVIRCLFRAYQREPRQMPPHVARRCGQEPVVRVIADYIAGMTDRFAVLEYEKLYDPRVRA